METFSLQELGLPDDIWAPFREARQAQHYAAGQLIYLQDTPAEGFYYLCSGRVNAFLSSEEGDERVLAVYQSGNLFGEASFFNEMPRITSAMTVTECEIVFISRATAAALLSEKPQRAMALLKYLSRTIWMLSNHLDGMAFRPAEERVVRYLLSLPRSADGLVRCTQEEISAAVSASRVTVSRVLSRLARQGLLETRYGAVVLLEPEALAAIC
jgi:CRP/FNR family transcriptional regulator